MRRVHRRSKLFTPGVRPDLMAKAAQGAADMVVLDLEDSVRTQDKAVARDHVREALRTLDFGTKECGVRINAIGSNHWLSDLLAVFCEGLQAVHLPKVTGPRDVWVAEAVLADLERKAGRRVPVRIIPTLESAAGIQHARAIANASQRVTALQFGLGDLVAELGLEPSEHRLAYFRTRIVLAAHSAGIPALDTVFFDIRDVAGFRAEAREARALGLRGKSCIHPDQVLMANEVFSPTHAETAHALEVLAAYEAGLERGEGVVTLRGRMIDLPVAEEARRILSLIDEPVSAARNDKEG